MKKFKIILLLLLISSIVILYSEKICPECGREYPDTEMFCSQDGVKLVKQEPKTKQTRQSDIPGGKPDYTIKDMELVGISDNEDTISLRYSLEDRTYAYVFLKYRIDKGKWQYCKNKYIIGDMNKKIYKQTNAFSWVYGKEIEGTALTRVEMAIDVWFMLKFVGKNSKGYKEYKKKKDGSTLVYIPASKFTMGSNDGGNDEDPIHTVYLDGYYISKYEITNAQYKQFCDETNRGYPKGPDFDGMSNYFKNYPNYPVVKVDWNDAKAYCDWAGLKLPTEAQWEKGAGGTDSRKYPWGGHAPYYNGSYYANYEPSGGYSKDGYRDTSPVGHYTRGQSPYGLMDMAGNVLEWCSDWYDSDYYSSSPGSNPKGPSSGSKRVLRGGSWISSAYGIRCANRYGGTPSNDYLRYYCNGIGFRPALY